MKLDFLRARKKGVALVIVLAFLVLLTGIVVAYLGRTETERQLAQGTFREQGADFLALSALDILVADFKQEIVNGSTASTVNGTVIYNPTPAPNLQPVRSGNPGGLPDPIPNLVRRSVRNDPMVAPGVASRASAVNSTTDASINGRSITLSRWNKHYLIPRPLPTPKSETDTTPVASFTAPDWVIVTRAGPTPCPTWNPSLADAAPSNNSYSLGRYAFAVYDEGGLIDVNVAGYPSNTSVAQSGPKGILSFADFTPLGIPSAADDLVGWRNYATAQPSGTFGMFTFTTASATNYFNAAIPNANDFITASAATWNNRTDQKFVTRQILIQYRNAGKISFSVGAMQYLGTFSRERNISTWNNSQIPRFPIAKLTEVTSTGDAAKIKADFGLVLNTDHWDYYGRAGTALASSIGAFEYAAPEFFQLLNYALPGRTIGEILTVGASTLDQNDADDNVTVIEYAGSVPPNPRAYGVETVPPPPPAPTPPATPTVLNHALRSVGEFGYAYKDVAAGSTLNFTLNPAPDAGVLDLFSYTSATRRAGAVNLNTRNPAVIAALVSRAIQAQPSTTVAPSPAAVNIGNAFVSATASAPAFSRQDLARLTQTISASLVTTDENQREVISRALSDVCQTRTWNLMIDVVAQSGRYPPNAQSLADFVVEGEKRYWLHVAIDRFTGEVIDQQLEAVYE